MVAEGEAHGVGAVGRDDVERVDAVAEGLGHLAALAVLDDGVDEDVAEGDGAFAGPLPRSWRRGSSG
jgi:hypothetical protein